MMNLEEVINKAVEKSVKEAILAAHPVGSFYFSDNDINPAEVFGGGYGNEQKGRFSSVEILLPLWVRRQVVEAVLILTLLASQKCQNIITTLCAIEARQQTNLVVTLAHQPIQNGLSRGALAKHKIITLRDIQEIHNHTTICLLTTLPISGNEQLK